MKKGITPGGRGVPQAEFGKSPVTNRPHSIIPNHGQRRQYPESSMLLFCYAGCRLTSFLRARHPRHVPACDSAKFSMNFSMAVRATHEGGEDHFLPPGPANNARLRLLVPGPGACSSLK